MSNIPVAIEKIRQRYASDPEYRSRLLGHCRKYKQRHQEHFRRYNHCYYEKNREHILSQKREKYRMSVAGKPNLTGKRISELIIRNKSDAQRSAVILSKRDVPRPPLVRDRISKGVCIAYTMGRSNCFNYKRETYKGITFKSSWEIIIAMWLDSMDLQWEYEPIFFKRKNGRRYIPDFRIDGKYFIEVKGYCSKDDMDKMNEFVKAGNKLYIIDNVSKIDIKEWRVM